VGVLAGSGTGRQADEDSGDAGGWGFASSTDPETWASFETALEYTETKHADGVGFVFTDDDPIVGVDIDDCRDPETGDVDDAALDIIGRLDSYTEVSPSGTGYHVLLTGELPDGRNRRGSVELYDTARFFTVTGEHVERTPTRVARRQDALTAIHREYVQDTERDTASESGQRDDADDKSASGGGVDVDVDLEDEDLLEKARNASNGEKFERLWNGEYGRLRQSVRGRYGAVLFAGVLDRRRPDADGAAVSPVRIASGEVGRGPLR